MDRFLDKYLKSREEKNSVLCVGLDPDYETRGEDPLDWCMELVEKTSDYAVAYKPNTQFILFNMNMRELKKLAGKIKSEGCVSILDHKLSDIGSSNRSAIHWTGEAGFDSITVSPFPGNIAESVDCAHEKGIGVFVLALMSNPEAKWLKDARINDMPVYEHIAGQVKETGCDGLVIGTTNHVTPFDIRRTRELAGDSAVFLCPGIGAQGGSVETLMENAGGNVLINVGRAIIKDNDPESRAREYLELINRHR